MIKELTIEGKVSKQSLKDFYLTPKIEITNLFYENNLEHLDHNLKTLEPLLNRRMCVVKVYSFKEIVMLSEKEYLLPRGTYIYIGFETDGNSLSKLKGYLFDAASSDVHPLIIAPMVDLNTDFNHLERIIKEMGVGIKRIELCHGEGKDPDSESLASFIMAIRDNNFVLDFTQFDYGNLSATLRAKENFLLDRELNEVIYTKGESFKKTFVKAFNQMRKELREVNATVTKMKEDYRAIKIFFESEEV